MQKKRILIVDDDPQICQIAKTFLDNEGYSVSIAADGKAMWEMLEQTDNLPELFLVDLMLPGEDGLTLVRELHKRFHIPIIIISAKDDLVDKVAGLEVGADDYIGKPFHPRELLARIRSVMRRSYEEPVSNTQLTRLSSDPEDSILPFNGWVLNLRSHTLHNPQGEEIYLTSHEFSLLEIFVTRANCVLSREFLLNSIGSQGQDPFDRTIDVLVGKLRKKLEDDIKQPKLIKTIRGRGYIFVGSENSVKTPE